jgi:hypothetical protein
MRVHHSGDQPSAASDISISGIGVLMRKHSVTQSESGRWNYRGDGVKATWRLRPASGLRRRDTQVGRPVMAGGSPFRVTARFLPPGFGWPGQSSPGPRPRPRRGCWSRSGRPPQPIPAGMTAWAADPSPPSCWSTGRGFDWRPRSPPPWPVLAREAVSAARASRTCCRLARVPTFVAWKLVIDFWKFGQA